MSDQELIGKIYDRLLLTPTREETEQIVARENRKCRRIQRKRCGKTNLPPAVALPAALPPAPDPKPWDLSWLKAVIPAAILLGALIGGALGWIPATQAEPDRPAPPLTAPKGGPTP